MKYTSYSYPSGRAEVAAFVVTGGVTEYHVMIHATDPKQTYREQMNVVLDAYAALLKKELSGAVAVFKRYFLSDAANQAVLPNGLYEVKHGVYRQLWMGGSFNRAANSEYQMRLLLNDYAMQLMEEGCTLADNCLRTWIFVQNVDCNYAGVVKARNEMFVTQNLTENTHYIASTGIGGRHADPKALVMLDAFAVAGLKPGQIKYLYARTHLNPTYEYGVSFERGTAVDYDDRRQVLISGTASINNRGEVLYAGDVRRQTERMWENVEALLKEADCGFGDVGHIIVYLRDIADYAVVKEMFDKRFPDIPRVVTLAPVCRPGWLVEMECMAVKKISD